MTKKAKPQCERLEPTSEIPKSMLVLENAPVPAPTPIGSAQPSAVLDRLRAFLPEMAQANKILQADIEKYGAQHVRLEISDDDNNNDDDDDNNNDGDDDDNNNMNDNHGDGSNDANIDQDASANSDTGGGEQKRVIQMELLLGVLEGKKNKRSHKDLIQNALLDRVPKTKRKRLIEEIPNSSSSNLDNNNDNDNDNDNDDDDNKNNSSHSSSSSSMSASDSNQSSDSQSNNSDDDDGSDDNTNEQETLLPL